MAEADGDVVTLTDRDVQGLLQMAGEMRGLARKMTTGEASLDQAIYEHLRLQAAFEWLPLIGKAP